MSFTIHPKSFLTGTAFEETKTNLVRYLKRFTGSWFEDFADHDRPDEFTNADFTALTTVSVQLPAQVAIWLTHEGRRDTAALLSAIPTDLHLRDASHDLLSSPQSPLVDLWNLLQRPTSQWERSGKPNEVGPVIAGKLLAAKRPHLVPIYDQHVARALQPQENSYWMAWQETLQDPELVAAVVSLRAALAPTEVGALSHRLSDLRLLDIAVWMAVHGSVSSGG